LYTIIAAGAAGLVSLPVIGPNVLFLYGLAIGACVAIIALNIISRTIDRAAGSGKKAPVLFGFFIRVLLYGGALYFAASTSVLTFAGAAAGLLLPHAAMYIMYGLVLVIKRKLKNEPAPTWVPDTRSLLFIKEPQFEKPNKGRTYLTHRHYRKIRVTSDGT